MALTVSTDLSVNTGPTYVDEKLEDKQKALRESIEKGEPKIFGVSQIVIGLLIISYAIPLLFGDATVILNSGVPWWSGIMSVISGAAAITLEKKPTLKTHFNTGVKATISVVGLVQTGLSTAFTVILYNQRKSFTGYVIVNE